MKRNTIFTVLLILMLLTACGAAPVAGETTCPPETTGAAPAPEIQEPEQTAPARADYFHRVFDTSQDEGKLTVRYLALSTTEGVGYDAVTTGDCAVYTSPEGLTMLVDCSNEACAEEIILQLQAMQVEKIDILVISHPHADHIGSFCAIADAFPIGQIYTNGHDYDSRLYESCVDKINEWSIPCEPLCAGDSFFLGEQVEITVYGPQPGEVQEVAAGYQDANDGSLAMRIVYGQSSFWTSGDLYTTGEAKLVELYGEALRSDVVKMNHHGKYTSNGLDFVRTVDPIIAVGMFDSVGNVTVARRFLAAGAQVFYNQPDGAIRISTTGDGTYDVQTQYLRQLDILPQPSADGHYIVSRPRE